MNSSALALPANRPQKNAGDAYLKFQLAPKTPAVFSMRYVQEAIILPTRRLTPMPNMPSPMLGLTNRRSRVFWVVDLAQMLGIAALDANVQQYTLILMQVGSVPLGLAIQQVKGIAWFHPDAVQSPLRQVTTALVPYLRGCILQQHEQLQEILLVLDAEAIVQSPILRSI
ncbi:MAG: purine-binding chemotaxis protein CheW [Cyanobacteria bacterium CRU_2_1]|nr:purine-binding chemotaxis protein CheW [Cyanobacteria bacterium RU_5_0]NJR61655.1 purine-binding chemotaxis protein CheW [Cyanobacteria bacterium CRU_2_1]